MYIYIVYIYIYMCVHMSIISRNICYVNQVIPLPLLLPLNETQDF